MSNGDWKELFLAACAGDLALVEYHVERGVDINFAHPEFLSTPLVACILAQQEDVAMYLLSSGADPDLPSELDGLSPLQAARLADLPRLVDRLVSLGAEAPLQAVEPASSRRWWTLLR